MLTLNSALTHVTPSVVMLIRSNGRPSRRRSFGQPAFYRSTPRYVRPGHVYHTKRFNAVHIIHSTSSPQPHRNPSLFHVNHDRGSKSHYGEDRQRRRADRTCPASVPVGPQHIVASLGPAHGMASSTDGRVTERRPHLQHDMTCNRLCLSRGPSPVLHDWIWTPLPDSHRRSHVVEGTH